MSYYDVKDGLKKVLFSLGYNDSNEVFDFDTQTEFSVKDRFRIERTPIDLEGDDVEFMNNLVRPISEYTITIGFKLSEDKQTFDYDVAQAKIDSLIAKLSNPANYSSTTIIMKIRNIEIERILNYLEAKINLFVQDNLTLT